MKRFASVITGISLIALLAACGSEPQPSNTTTAQSQAPAAEATAAPAETQDSASEAQASNPEVQPSATQPSAATASTAAILTEEDAKNIALTDAGVTEADVTGIRVKLDTDHGVQEYEVEFYAGNLEYDYDIDAATGQIRGKDMDIEDDFFPVQTGNVTIAEADAIALVLEKVPGAVESDVRIHLDYDDGRAVYEGSLVLDQTEYEFEIDAETGSFLEWEQESIYD